MDRLKKRELLTGKIPLSEQQIPAAYLPFRVATATVMWASSTLVTTASSGHQWRMVHHARGTGALTVTMQEFTGTAAGALMATRSAALRTSDRYECETVKAQHFKADRKTVRLKIEKLTR